MDKQQHDTNSYHRYFSISQHISGADYWLLLLLILLFAANFAEITRAVPPSKKPLTPDLVRQQLELADQITWQQMPLRQGLNNISSSWNIPIFLDRRIDPDQLIDFQSQNSRQQLLTELAEQLSITTCLVDTVVYFGPAQTTDVIAAVAESRFDEAQKWGAAGRALRKRVPCEWQEGAQPRQLVQQLAATNKIHIENIDEIPLDVWPAASWPATPLTHQLALILAGFGLTYENAADNRLLTLRIIPLPAEFSLRRTYQVPGNAAQRVEKWKGQFPKAAITLSGKSMTVIGTAEDHYHIRRQVLGIGETRPRPVVGQEKRYTLTLMNKRFEDVATTIAKALGLEIEYDPQLESRKDQRIDLSLQDATAAELLDELLKSIDAQYTIEGGKLRIHN